MGPWETLGLITDLGPLVLGIPILVSVKFIFAFGLGKSSLVATTYVKNLSTLSPRLTFHGQRVALQRGWLVRQRHGCRVALQRGRMVRQRHTLRKGPQDLFIFSTVAYLDFEKQTSQLGEFDFALDV